MNPLVSLEALLGTEDAVLVSDGEGVVRLCNEAAVSLLDRKRSAVIDRPCWQVLELRRPDGSRFCGRDCPVQRQMRSSRPAGRQRVLRQGRDDDLVRLDLLTLPLARTSRFRRPVLHVLLPLQRDDRAAIELSRASHPLTPREREVLYLLACGRSTAEVADELFISPVTVRNHTQRILGKLGVHTRLEAVLAWLGRAG